MKHKQQSLPTIQATFDNFINLKQSQGLSQATIHNYQASFELFLMDMHLFPNDEVTIIASDTIQQWTIKMQKNGKKASTINHYLRDVRCYYYYLQEQGLITGSKVHCVKKQEEVPKGYTEDEVKLLLKKPSKKDNYSTWRSWLICNIILGTGARIGSVVSLTKESIDWQAHTISFPHSKNKQHLQVPMSPALEQAFIDFENEWDNKSQWVVPSDDGTQSTQSGCLQAHRKYCKNRGIEAGTLHGLRHTFARLCAVGGMDIYSLQRILGHSSIQMTAHYISLMVTDIKINAVPLDNLLNSKVQRKR